MKIGILGGGQLGLMMFRESIGLNLDLHFMDKQRDFPVGKLAHNFIEGDFTDYDDVIKFGADKDVIGIEIEKVNLQALYDLEAKSKLVHPNPRALEIIQDKGLQKLFYKKEKLSSSTFNLTDTREDILQLIDDERIRFPFVQKYRTGGYDGKGVQIIASDQEIEKIVNLPSVIEPLVDIDKELAVIACRNANGDIVTYPCVEMVFDPELNLVKYLFSPADITEQVAKDCDAMARQLIKKFDISGLLAVEFFLTKEGEILINEVAPRPHNSGHHTLDGMSCSQFENHLRGITNLPLGSTHQHTQAAMVNILGENDYTGKAIYKGLNKILELSDVHVHMYQKSITKPGRKMGHINVLGSDMNEIENKIEIINQEFKVIA